MGRFKTLEERQNKQMIKKGKVKQERLFVKGSEEPQQLSFSKDVLESIKTEQSEKETK